MDGEQLLHTDQEGLESLHQKNELFLESKYQGDVAVFRAEVIRRMNANDAMHGKIGWLYYREQPEDSFGTLVDAQAKDTLIIIARSKSKPPRIKILTNTEYRIGDTTEFMTEEITVDNEGDAQLLVDVVYFDEDFNVLPSKDPDCPTQSIVFGMGGQDKLNLWNFHEYTPLDPITSEITDNNGQTKSVEIYPFGADVDFGERIAALERATQLLANTQNAELVAKHQPDSQ